MKKALPCCSSWFVSIFAAGCGGPSAGDAKAIKVANYFADDHPQNAALREKFKPMVEA